MSVCHFLGSAVETQNASQLAVLLLLLRAPAAPSCIHTGNWVCILRVLPSFPYTVIQEVLWHISGDRECRWLGQKEFILGKCKPPWEFSINNLRKETSQRSCTVNNISRALSSFDNLETTCFVSEAALKYAKTYL